MPTAKNTTKQSRGGGRLLPVAELARFTPYSVEFLILQARAGQLLAVNSRGNWKTTKDAVTQYVEAHHRDANAGILPDRFTPSLLLTIREAAVFLAIHPNTLRNWERQGKIASVRIGSRRDRRFTLQSLQKLDLTYF
jgi:excisionase family DNA binding protein